MSNELCHHGIDGQRWGVTHGPPYPLSRAEHRAVVKQAKKEAKSRAAAEKRNITYKKSKRYAKRMTDEDLNAAIDRLRREETYSQLVSKDKEAKAKAKEQKKEVKNQNGQSNQPGLVKTVAKDAVKTSVHNLVDKISNQMGISIGKNWGDELLKKQNSSNNKPPEFKTSGEANEYYKKQVEDYFSKWQNEPSYKVDKKYSKEKVNNAVKYITSGKSTLEAAGLISAETVIPKLMSSSSLNNTSVSDMNNYIIENMPASELLRITG